MSGLRLSPLAERDVEDIGYYIALDDFQAAERVVSRLFRAFELLAEHPELGRIREDLGNIRSLSVHPYVIFYRAGKRGLEIARVLHGARDVLTILEKEEHERGKGDENA